MANPNPTPPNTPTPSLSHLKTTLPRLPSTDATVLRHAHTLVTIALQRRHNPNQRHYRTLDPRHNVARIIPILALLDPENVYKNDADDAVVAASPEGRVLRKHAKSAAVVRGKLEGIVGRLYAEGWLDGVLVSQRRLLPPQFNDADVATEIVGGDDKEEEDDNDNDEDYDDDGGEQPNQDDGAAAWWWRDETAENESAATTPGNHTHSDTSHPNHRKSKNWPPFTPLLPGHCLGLPASLLLRTIATICPVGVSAMLWSARDHGECEVRIEALHGGGSGLPGRKGRARIQKTSGLRADEKSRRAVVTGEGGTVARLRSPLLVRSRSTRMAVGSLYRWLGGWGASNVGRKGSAAYVGSDEAGIE